MRTGRRGLTRPHRHRAAATILIGLLPVALQAADEGLVTRAFPLAGHGEFEIRYPAAWRQEIQNALGMPPTLVFTPPAGSDFIMQMTPFPDLKGTQPEEIRAMVEKMAEETLTIAVEPTLPVRAVDGPEMTGFAYSATDKAPKGGEWRCVTQGVARVGGLMATFTFLTQSHEAPEVGQAMETIRTARHRPAAAEPEAADRWALAFPGKSWSLVLDLPGFRSTGRQTRPDGRQVMAGGENDPLDMMITIYLEPADEPGNAVAYRERMRKRLRDTPPREVDVATSERGLMAMLEYRIDRAMGIPLNQKHMNGILVHDDVWIDIHVSKTGYDPRERPLFDAIYDSVRIVQNPGPASGASGPAVSPADDAPVPAAGPAEAAGTFRTFTVPGQGWSLVLDALGIVMDSVREVPASATGGTMAEGRVAAGRIWSGSAGAAGYRLTVLIQAADRPGDAIVCRDVLWERLREPGTTRVRKAGDAAQATVESTVPGNKTRDLRIFRVHEGSWIAIHLSKVEYKDSDSLIFGNLRSSVAIRADGATRP